MPAGSVQCRTLQKALAAVGSVDALGKILAVPAADLEKWLAGIEDPPMPVFLNLVDFLLEQSRGFITQTDGRPIENQPAPRNGSEDK